MFCAKILAAFLAFFGHKSIGHLLGGRQSLHAPLTPMEFRLPLAPIRRQGNFSHETALITYYWLSMTHLGNHGFLDVYGKEVSHALFYAHTRFT